MPVPDWVALDGVRGRVVHPVKVRKNKTDAGIPLVEPLGIDWAACRFSTWPTWERRYRFVTKAPKRRLTPFLDDKALARVRRQKTPTAYLWGDLFSPVVRDEWLDACFDVMAETPRHLHFVITKYPNRTYLAGESPLDRVVLGVSYENQATAEARLPELLWTPAWQRIALFEPALGAVSLQWAACRCIDKSYAMKNGHLASCPLVKGELCSLLHRVIYSGEAGGGARPNWIHWARSTRDQCGRLRIPFFVNQLGSFPTDTDIGTDWFEDHPRQVVKLALTPAPDRKRPSLRGHIPAEWPAEFQVRE